MSELNVEQAMTLIEIRSLLQSQAIDVSDKSDGEVLDIVLRILTWAVEHCENLSPSSQAFLNDLQRIYQAERQRDNDEDTSPMERSAKGEPIMRSVEVESQTPYEVGDQKPWPEGDGFAQVVLHQIAGEAQDGIGCEWRGPKDWPLEVHGEFLRTLSAGGLEYEDALAKLLPWPLEYIGPRPDATDIFLFRRRD